MPILSVWFKYTTSIQEYSYFYIFSTLNFLNIDHDQVEKLLYFGTVVYCITKYNRLF